MARATNDLNAVRAVLGPGIMYSINTVVILITALTLMLVLSWQLTLISLIPLPLISLFMYRYGRVIHKRFEVVQARFSDITARAQEYLSGIRVVHAYTQEEAAIEDFREMNLRYLEENMALVRINGLFYPAIGFLAGTGSVLVLGFGGLLVIREDDHPGRLRGLQRLSGHVDLAHDRPGLGGEPLPARRGLHEAHAGCPGSCP